MESLDRAISTASTVDNRYSVHPTKTDGVSPSHMPQRRGGGASSDVPSALSDEELERQLAKLMREKEARQSGDKSAGSLPGLDRCITPSIGKKRLDRSGGDSEFGHLYSEKAMGAIATQVGETMEFNVRIYKKFIEPFLYPFFIVPKSTNTFITFLFWHSFLMTLTTPLFRIIRGRWMAVLTCQWVLNNVGLGHMFNTTRDDQLVHGDSLFIYGTEETYKGLDLPFSLHAGFGMAWLTVAYLQMGPIRTRSLKLHRKFGYFAAAIFLGHLSAATNILLYDEAHHQPLNKALLFSPVATSFMYMVHAIMHARRHDGAAHTDDVMRAYVFSIEGAGTIRSIAAIQGLFTKVLGDNSRGTGPCQRLYAGGAHECLGPYATRMIFVRFLSLYWIGMYARMRKDAEFTKVFVTELFSTFTLQVVMLFVLASPYIKYLEETEKSMYAITLYRLFMVAYYLFPLFQVEAKEEYVRKGTTMTLVTSERIIRTATRPVARAMSRVMSTAAEKEEKMD